MSPPVPPAARTLRRDAARVLDEDLSWHARLAARRLTAALDEALVPVGVSSLQFGLLCLIASSADDSVGTLAARAGLNASTMSRNLDQLAAAGWVELVTAEADRRRRAVWLTETGATRLQEALPAWRSANRALARTLGPDRLEQLAGIGVALEPEPPADE